VKNLELRIVAGRNGNQARKIDFGEDDIKGARNYLQRDSATVSRKTQNSRSHREPRPLFEAWPEIRARVRASRHVALFLDFDGTLVQLRRRPSEVRMPGQTKRLLESLAWHSSVFVAIISGRRLRDLQTMIAVPGVHTFGLHGAERVGRKTALSKRTRRALALVKRETRSQLGVLPGIWLEDKVLSLAVHFRGASPAIVREADAILMRILAPLHRNLFTVNGEKVWEILPREIEGKGATILEVLAAHSRQTLTIYAGDDTTDESAFAALPNQITIQVGKRSNTRARFHLQKPADVLRFLTKLERELP
jgi:trehalose 6-phosphate phosphatase